MGCNEAYQFRAVNKLQKILFLEGHDNFLLDLYYLLSAVFSRSSILNRKQNFWNWISSFKNGGGGVIHFL